MEDLMNILFDSYKVEFNTALMLSFLIYNIKKLNIINSNISGIDLRKCEITIDNTFKLLEYNIYFKVEDIIIKNNVDENREFIKSNIKKIVYDSYYKVFSDLNAYRINKQQLNTFMSDDWLDELYAVCELHVFSKTPVTDRLESLRRTLDTNINSYKTKLINKSINKLIN